MYGFILSMFIAGKITETKVREYAAKGIITEQEADLIIATPKL